MSEQENLNLNKEKKDSVVGPLIGSILIVVLLLLGGLYFWGYIEHNQSEDDVASMQEELSEIENDFAKFESEINIELEESF